MRTLDLAPLDDPGLECGVEELAATFATRPSARALVDGADVLVHAAAALPIQSSREAIRSVNVDGTANVLVAALEAGVRRAVVISSTAVYGVPEKHPIFEDDPLVGVGWYGESKIEAERARRRVRRGGAGVGDRATEDVRGAGAARGLRDPVRLDPRGAADPDSGDGANRYQLLAVEDLVDAIVRCFDAPVAG